MQLLDGKKLANQIKLELKEKVDTLKQTGARAPHLAAVLVGLDGASQTYVNHKVNACHQIGFESTLIRKEATTTTQELLDIIQDLNQNKEIDGFIVQLPLPKHIDEQQIIAAIDPAKDVDGFHPINVGRMNIGSPCFVSATPLGITVLLERYGIETSGKHCVVLGRSNIVGRPMSVLMSSSNATGNCTVTLCHSRTQQLEKITQQADIVIAALGKPNFVQPDMLKQGAVLVDVGITRVPSAETNNGYKLVGDVDFEAVKDKCSWITPVPGGVGPMTVTSLLMNTFKAATDNPYQ